MGSIIIEETLKNDTPIRMECMGLINRIIVTPKKDGQSYKFAFSFKTRKEAEQCFLDLFNETAQLWQYMSHLPNDQRAALKKFLEPANEDAELEFTFEQIERIDEIYDETVRLCSFYTDGKFNRDDTAVYGELADMIAEFLTKHNYPVYFPTHITTDDEEKIVDIYE